MTVFVVDTSVLVYAADRHAPEHGVCRDLVECWRADPSPWYLTWGIVYEFLRVVSHPRVLRQPFPLGEAWRFMEALLASPGVDVLVAGDRHPSVAAEVFETSRGLSGNLLFDAHTAILMKEHGLRTIYTRDADFHRFPFLDVIDPVQGTRRGTLREKRARYRARS